MVASAVGTLAPPGDHQGWWCSHPSGGGATYRGGLQGSLGINSFFFHNPGAWPGQVLDSWRYPGQRLRVQGRVQRTGTQGQCQLVLQLSLWLMARANG